MRTAQLLSRLKPTLAYYTAGRRCHRLTATRGLWAVGRLRESQPGTDRLTPPLVERLVGSSIFHLLVESVLQSNLVRPFDTPLVTRRRPLLKCVEGLFEIENGAHVLSTAKLTMLVKLESL